MIYQITIIGCKGKILSFNKTKPEAHYSFHEMFELGSETRLSFVRKIFEHREMKYQHYMNSKTKESL